jgi:hypothetical protein
MSPEQAVTEYVKLMKQVFSDKKLIGTSGSSTYKAKNLREGLRSMIRSSTGNEEEKLMEQEAKAGGCKT